MHKKNYKLTKIVEKSISPHKLYMPRISTSSYQQTYRIKNHDRIQMLQRKQYALYSHDYIGCPFCAKLCRLVYAKQHLKTKSCKEFQSVCDDGHDKYVQFIKEINELKSKLKLDLLEENDEVAISA